MSYRTLLNSRSVRLAAKERQPRQDKYFDAPKYVEELKTMSNEPKIISENIIEITPEMDRRVREERRREPREHIAKLERELRDLRRAAKEYFLWQQYGLAALSTDPKTIRRDLLNALGVDLNSIKTFDAESKTK
jgi:hypothetical protein